MNRPIEVARKRLESMSAEERKNYPLWSGVFQYFPNAMMAIAKVSMIGAKQHNGGNLFWDMEKSSDDTDALLRHMVGGEEKDLDGVSHEEKALWRAVSSYERKFVERFENGKEKV